MSPMTLNWNFISLNLEKKALSQKLLVWLLWHEDTKRKQISWAMGWLSDLAVDHTQGIVSKFSRSKVVIAPSQKLKGRLPQSEKDVKRSFMTMTVTSPGWLQVSAFRRCIKLYKFLRINTSMYTCQIYPNKNMYNDKKYNLLFLTSLIAISTSGSDIGIQCTPETWWPLLPQ